MTRPSERLDTMKLSTTPIPANSQDMRLQGIRSIKHLSKKLVASSPFKSTRKSNKKTSRPVEESSHNGAQPAATSVQRFINRSDSKRTRLLLNLLLVRPWVLVLGFWLFSMAVGSLALSGMLSPRKLTQALPEPPVIESTQSEKSAIRVEKAEEEKAIEGETPTVVVGSDNASALTADSGSSFPIVPLSVLVGSCAAGSLLISRRRALMQMSAARAQRHTKGKSPTKSSVRKSPARSQIARSQTIRNQGATAETSGTNKGISHKKRRQRVRRNAAATAGRSKANQQPRVLASRTNAQQLSSTQTTTQKSGTRKDRLAKAVKQKVGHKRSTSARAQANRVQAKRATKGARRRASQASMRVASRRQPIVSVVPASESHALDWRQGSLAHQMDVRSQRRAM